MANIWTGGMGQLDKKLAAARNIAAQAVRGQAGEAKRKGRSKFLGSIGGFLGGEALQWGLGALLTAATGGLAGPALTAAIAAGKVSKYASIASKLQKGGKYARLAKAIIKGGGMTLGKHFVDKATKSKHKFLKTPGQVDEITSDSKYGYGEEEAKTLTEALGRSRESTGQDAGTLLGNIGGAYALDIMGDKGGDLLGKGKEVVKEGLDPVGDTFNPITDVAEPSEFRDFLESQGTSDPGTFNPFTSEKSTTQMGFPWFGGGKRWSFEGGGQVPNQEEAFMELLSLVQPQQQETAYSGTALEEKQQPSISDYFASQGKTLGGNNTQSLSQILGR